MKLLDEKSKEKKDVKRGWTMTRMISWVVLFCVIIVSFVVLINSKTEISNKHNLNEKPNSKNQISSNKKTSEELQIWDTLEEEPETVLKEEETPLPPQINSEKKEVPEGFFRITLKNGESETHRINRYIPENSYEFDRFSFLGKKTSYEFDNGAKSFVGIKVSKDNGYVDFNKVKKDGIDFVMISTGTRGYGTGQIVLDDYAVEHIKNASNAKLDIGLYFKSQAISEVEAIEEAEKILELIEDYIITYPITFEMERIQLDVGRTDFLSKIARTKIAIAFLSTIKKAGYDTSVYGDSEFLINDLDLSQLKLYDVWLKQESGIPEMPYKFSMWEFSQNEKIDGVSGNIPLSISLVDFQAK